MRKLINWNGFAVNKTLENESGCKLLRKLWFLAKENETILNTAQVDIIHPHDQMTYNRHISQQKLGTCNIEATHNWDMKQDIWVLTHTHTWVYSMHRNHDTYVEVHDVNWMAGSEPPCWDVEGVQGQVRSAAASLGAPWRAANDPGEWYRWLLVAMGNQWKSCSTAKSWKTINDSDMILIRFTKKIQEAKHDEDDQEANSGWS